MMATGITGIDLLLSGTAASPLGPSNATAIEVGFIQDMLIGHGFKELPGVLGSARGVFGPRTIEAVNGFQQTSGLPVTGNVDRPTLQALAAFPWPRPLACAAYVTLVLDVSFTAMVRIVALTSQFEGGGLFAAMNRNTDRAGLSFGLIQWAQKPGRLRELLRALQTAQPALFTTIFGDGDAAAAESLIAHTSRSNGGVDNAGCTVDPRFDLVSPPWDARFIAAGNDRNLQLAQLETAAADFRASFARLQVLAPSIRSERGVAFMLDVANQHGDAGAADIFRTVQAPGMSEGDLLAAVEQESVSRVRAKFGDGPETASTRARREAFRSNPALSDDPLVI